MGTRRHAPGLLIPVEGYGKVPSLKRESKEFELDEHSEQVVRQTTIALPFLDEQVPALIVADGRSYIPVFAVCRVLGIRADTHIQRWRRLIFWGTARKLLFQTEKRGQRLVWCLLISEVPHLYSLFDWSPLPPGRRRQLYEAAHAHAQLLEQVYQEMQAQYAFTRQALFFCSHARGGARCHILAGDGGESRNASFRSTS